MAKISLFAFVLLQAVYDVLGQEVSLPLPSLSFSSLPSTTSSGTPTQTPIFIFNSPPTLDITTCSQSLTFSWTFGGPTPPKGLTLYVTNVNVPQPDPPTTSSSSSLYSGTNSLTDRSGIITARAVSESIETGGHTTIISSSGTTSVMTYLIETLSTDLDPSAQSSFTWQQADVPQGWYEVGVNATDAGDVVGGVGGVWVSFFAHSESFFVRNGSDVSCLATNPGGSPTQTSSQGSTSVTATGQTSTGGQALPTSGSLASSGSVNKGAIAGAVVGGFVVIAVVLCAYLFIHRAAKRSRVRGNGGSGPGFGPSGAAEAGTRPGGMGKWGALGSFDSANVPASQPTFVADSKSAPSGIDSATAANTVANARSQRSNILGLGGMGLAALGLAKNPNDDSTKAPPSAYTTGSTSKKTRRTRRSQADSRASAGSESMKGMMSISPSDSSFSPTSSGNDHSQSQSYGWLGHHYGVTVDPTRPSEDDDYVYSPYEEKSVPLRTLSPTSSSAHSPVTGDAGPYQRSPFSDAGHASSPLTPQTPEEDYPYGSYPSSSNSMNDSSGMGFIPIGYEPSPFATPPPSVPTSRANSRTYSRNSGSSLRTGSIPSSAVGVAGHSSPSDVVGHGPSQLSLVSSPEGSSDATSARRARAKSELPSPTSHHSGRMYGSSEAPDVPVTPGHDSISLSSSSPVPELSSTYDTSHARRASSPDVLALRNVSPLSIAAEGRKSSQQGSTTTRRTPRKPVPSYDLEGQEGASPTSTQDPTSMQTPKSSSSRPGPTRRPAPTYSASASASASASSSVQNLSSTSQQLPTHTGVHSHVLEHKDSAHSLASLRNMEGDLSGYGVVIGQSGGKQMHLLIPDMPLAQD